MTDNSESNTGPEFQKDTPAVPALPTKKPGKFLMYYALFITFAILTTAIFVFFRNKSGSPSVSTSNDSNIGASVTPAKENSALFVFLRDFSLYLKTADGATQVKDAADVYGFDYFRSGNLLVFISGQKAEMPDEYKGPAFIEPQYIYFYDLNGTKPEKIFDLKPQKDDNSDYTNQIRDVSFSQDGSMIAITTSQDLLIYDIKESKLEKVFSLPPDKTNRGFVYAYRDPVFSPDNSKVLITKGYYEGASQAVVEVSSGRMTDLPFDYYVSGKRAAEWKDDNTLLAYEYSDSTEANNSGSRLFHYSIKDKSEEEISKIKGSVYSVITHGGKYYALTSWGVENPGGYIDQYNDLYSYDPSSNDLKMLLSIKQITPENDNVGISGLVQGSENDSLYVETYKLKMGQSTTVSTINLWGSNKPNNLTVIEDNATLPL